jgi:signal transduction histidine kinase
MQNKEVEPGVLSILRWFTASRALLTALQILHMVFIGVNLKSMTGAWYFLTAVVVDTYLLLGYLFIPWLQKHLKSWYVPIALAVITIGSIVEGYWIAQEIGPYAVISETFIILFIPLVLIAWLYRFWLVLLFSLGTGFIEFFILLPLLTDNVTGYARVGALVVRTVTFMLVGYMINTLMKDKEKQQQELRKTNQQLELANIKLVQNASMVEQLSTSRERNRLAREMHDTLAHTLSGLAVQLDAIPSVWDSNPEKANRMLLEALDVTRSGLDETRRALKDLRATPLEEMGLAIAVRTLAEDAAGRFCLKVALDIPGQINNLPPDVEQSFYRIAQEAVQNTVKHSGATCLSLALNQVNGSVLLEVADDGSGFAAAEGTSGGQYGLTGMRERAELMGAQFEIQSSPGKGTAVRVKWVTA